MPLSLEKQNRTNYQMFFPRSILCFSCHSISLLFSPAIPLEGRNGPCVPSPVISQEAYVIFPCGICCHHSKGPADVTKTFPKENPVLIKLKLPSAFSRNDGLLST